ncbi:MAG TPA: YbbR-like domain-containing protein [Ignavibacteria bacterium]|nr:YbbR-like domain-containing protein [Ignavibacteria bacterium]
MSYSLDLVIPVEIQSSKSQALSEEIPNSIDVTVKGNGWDLLNIMISKDVKYSLDVSKLKKDSRIITEQFVNERLNLSSNVTVLKINPDTINISFDKLSEKYIPIKNNITVNLNEGYSIIGEPVLTPDSVMISGSSYLINKIKFVPTEVKIFNNVNSELSGTVNIKDTLSNIVKIYPTKVNFSYKVQLSAEKNFDGIEVVIINVPDDKEVLLVPPKISLSLRGGVDQLSQINSSDIDVNVQYKDIETDTLGFIIPEIFIPEETNILKIEPQKLQYIIKKKL